MLQRLNEINKAQYRIFLRMRKCQCVDIDTDIQSTCIDKCVSYARHPSSRRLIYNIVINITRACWYNRSIHTVTSSLFIILGDFFFALRLVARSLKVATTRWAVLTLDTKTPKWDLYSIDSRFSEVRIQITRTAETYFASTWLSILERILLCYQEATRVTLGNNFHSCYFFAIV